jgi:hypothetical protein
VEILAACSSAVENTRASNALRHDLLELILVAVFCGAKDCTDMQAELFDLFRSSRAETTILKAVDRVAQQRSSREGYEIASIVVRLRFRTMLTQQPVQSSR